ncbi:MAG: bifunctional [glutamate--ammonia ligase]-adenylyl-L-tyrosine phosphorylase/[glutamate--ammonia-ligase] adenylyltransferase [Gemmataceae bacterium]
MPSSSETVPPSWGLTDPARGVRNLAAIRTSVTSEPYDTIVALLDRYLPHSADADRALNNLDRLLAVPAARDRLPLLMAGDGRGLAEILAVLAASQFFADTLVSDPEGIDLARGGIVRSPSTTELIAELRNQVDASRDDAAVLRAFRRFRRLQTLRVGANDLVRERPLEEITRDLSRVADAAVAVSVSCAMRSLARKFGTPTTAAGQPARLTALAFGKLGGDELNYSSDLDLMFVYDSEGETTGKKVSLPNSEFFARTVSEVLRLLNTHTDFGFAYRVDLRLRPEGQRGALAKSFDATRSYYDISGRTWERQALIKLRTVGGDRELGEKFVEAIQPFIYRKYFSFSEINEVKSLKRRMEQRAAKAGDNERDVKTGRGGIRDIEYTVQFLQLLNGGDLPAVRQRNTLLGLEALEITGCLTPQETFILADAYRFLRKTEHRLQLLFDWQTHRLPDGPDELRRLSRRMGYGRTARPHDANPENDVVSLETRPDPLEQFTSDFRQKTSLDRTILDHLLHQSFADSAGQDEPEADLILHPDPDPTTVSTALSPYHFRDSVRAFQNLLRLARESVPFLSGRRCRHFLASIAPALLKAVAATADPDSALEQFERVTASLGAKAILYELFSVNPAALKLYVDLCSGSPFLSSLLINNPGMIDELLDSLVLDQPRTGQELDQELTELLRGANDPDPILHSFRDKELLRVGVRDLLDKDPIRETTASLSDLADTIVDAAFALAERDLPLTSGPIPYAVVGLGKLGGRELGYHSDLDLLVLFEPSNASSREGEKIAERVQRAIKLLSRPGPLGRLYDVDMRLRPFGKSASLVLPLDEFQRYSASDACQLWERQSLTRARVIRGEPKFAVKVMSAVRDGILAKPWSCAMANEIRSMRAKLDASTGNVKRGPGGIADVEFAVQLLQIKYGHRHPAILHANIWTALDAAAGLLPSSDVETLRTGYTFLRKVESRLRIVSDRPATELPVPGAERDRLARRLGFNSGESLGKEYDAVTKRIRSVFDAIVAREREG